jgi:hypothetical protein
MKNSRNTTIGIIIAVVVIVVLIIVLAMQGGSSTESTTTTGTSTLGTTGTTTATTTPAKTGGTKATKPTTTTGGQTGTQIGTPKPTPATPAWLTYANSDWGFRINYPGSWMAGQSTVLSGTPIVFCPANVASTDRTLICQMTHNSPQMGDSLAPIILIQAAAQNVIVGSKYMVLGIDKAGRNVYELYVADQNYADVAKQMADSFTFTN